ncbi:MAG: NHLP bacteriocin export ABC transporter permease/ATPase subunit [Elainella sp.]
MLSFTSPSTIQGNQPLLLNQPGQVRQVQSGSVAVFAVRLDQDEPVGPRRYLFTIEAGSVLISLPVGEAAPGFDQPPQFGFLAVAVEQTELIEWSLLDLPVAKAYPLLEDWIARLGSTVSLPQSIAPVSAATDQISLEPNQDWRPNRLVWARVQQGVATWLGNAGQPEFLFQPDCGCCPVSSQLWLKATGSVELVLQDPLDLDLPDLVGGLEQLHRWFLSWAAQQEQQQTQTAILRFQQRQQLNQQVSQTALRGLVGLLQPQLAAAAPADDLLMVCGAVGRVLGVKIEPPLASENLERLGSPLEAIARASRLRLRRVLLRDRWWQTDGGPIIAYRSNQRPVGLLPVAGDRYRLYDPNQATGQSLHQLPVVDAAVAATLDPTAYIFYRPLPDAALQAWDLARFAFQGQGRNLLLLLGMGLLGTLAGMAIPLATGLLVDTALPTGNQKLLAQVGLSLLLVVLTSVGFEWIQALATLRLETSSEVAMQAAVWDRLLKLKPAFFRAYTVGDLQSRVTGVSQIRRRLTGTTLRTILAGLFGLLNFGLMLVYSPSLAWVAAAVALLVMLVTISSGALLLRRSRRLLELKGEIFGLLVRLIEAVPKLRSAGAETRAFAVWGEKYRQQLALALSTQYIEDSVRIFNSLLPSLTAALIFGVLVLQLSHTPDGSGLSTGRFLAFSAAFGIFITGATSLSNAVLSVLEIVILWRRAEPILTAEPEVTAAKADPGRLSGQIRVDRLTFRYRDDGPLTLDQVSLDIRPGEFIALVGPSGSGKSTLMRLLLGFDSPLEGGVYYDGQDLAGLDVMAVRRQLGVVLQNSRINSGSIFDLIAANTPISVTEAWEAAEMAGFADDIRSMPMGMYTFVNEGGTNLSGGQRQRLMIARSLALKPNILLFDEATSALDNQTQAIVTQSLDRLGVTRIVVAHRLSTIRNADRIYVIQAGQVIQRGSFSELANQPGLFAQLIARQLGAVDPD